MTARLRVLLSALLLQLIATHAALATDRKLVELKTPRGVKLSFLLLKPERPVAAVILFAGGRGALGLTRSSMKWGKGNFLVRTRKMFASRGLAVAVVDAPSDRRKGINAIFRMSAGHARDISSVAEYLRTQSKVPVWVVGTSMGTFSAANAAIRLQAIDGLVLTSTVTRARPRWKIRNSHGNGVASMNLAKVKVPALIVAHKDDHCQITPAADVGKLTKALKNAAKVEVVVLRGGDKPRSKPCQARSQHGFFGIEAKAVDAIASFIRANSKSNR